jgi:hypothetical protein
MARLFVLKSIVFILVLYHRAWPFGRNDSNYHAIVTFPKIPKCKVHVLGRVHFRISLKRGQTHGSKVQGGGAIPY